MSATLGRVNWGTVSAGVLCACGLLGLLGVCSVLLGWIHGCGCSVGSAWALGWVRGWFGPPFCLVVVGRLPELLPVEGCAAGAVVWGCVYGMRRGGVPVVCETWVRLGLFVVIPVVKSVQARSCTLVRSCCRGRLVCSSLNLSRWVSGGVPCLGLVLLW